MDWLPLPCTLVTGPEWLAIDPAIRAAWLTLLGYCGQRDNGGVIKGARTWRKTDWDRLAGCSARVAEGICSAGLGTWQGDDLAVSHYPSDAETRSLAVREQRRQAAKSRWNRDADASASQMQMHESRNASRTASRNAQERRGEERINNTSAVGGTPPDPEPKEHPDTDQLASFLLEAIRTHRSGQKDARERWRHQLDLALRVDGISLARLKRAIDFAHRSAAGEFWRPNILSGEKLRAKFDTLEAQADRARFQLPAAQLGLVPPPAVAGPPPRTRPEQLTEPELYMWDSDACLPENYAGPMPARQIPRNGGAPLDTPPWRRSERERERSGGAK